jgi:signal transduction histidine kinase/ligand-binding sensor domain-containing protein
MRWLVLVAGLFLCTDAVTAEQYRYDQWTAESGLPQNVMRGIAQTPDGYLWIATLDGAARFDGVRFTVFNKSNTQGIGSNRFSSMVQGQDGDLWLTNEGGGITRCHHGSFHTYGAEDGIATNSVRGITSDSAGNLWILSEESILQWTEATGAWLDVTPDNLRVHYSPLHWNSAGFWGVDNNGLHIFTNGRFVTYTLPAWLPARSLWEVAMDENGTAWLESSDGKQAVIPTGKQLAQLVDSSHKRLSYRDPHGHVWTIRVEERLSRFLDFESSGQTTSIPLGWFQEDREGNVWIGREGSGLYRLQKQSIDVYSQAQGLIASNIYPVFQDRSGAIWVGAWPSGLSRFEDGNFQNFTIAQGLPGRLVSAITEDRNGDLWVATRDALSIFHDGHFRPALGIVLPEHSAVQAMLQDTGGTIWIGTSNGLVIYRDGPSKTLTSQDGLATDDVRTIVESRSGDIWLGGSGGLTRIHNGQFTRWTEREGLPSDNIRAIYEDADGVIWIGTYDGGLGRFKDGKFTRYRERDGLFNNGVFQILEDGRGNLWMSSNRGIYRVSKQELNVFAEGSLSTITSVAYGKSDGMLNVECNGGMWPAGIRTRNGKLWFPTQDGVAVIDPDTVRINPQPPPVVIEAALLDRTAAVLDGPLGIPPGKENLEIEYTALSFIHPEQIRFRYKLDGLDSEWIDAGARRTAYYSHLPPGSYTFHVIARNSDGVWNKEGKSLTINVFAPFYLTWWFIALEILTLAVLIAAAVRYRLSQLHRAQAMQKAFSQQLIALQENERQRIAAELHDSLGQRLVVINNLALFAMRSRRKAGAKTESGTLLEEGELSALKEISAETTLAIQETREISYNLRPFQLDRLGLTKAVEGILRSVSAASGIRIASQLDNIDDVFPEDLRINFYRIVQESLNNVMRHAQATEVEVRIARSEERMILSIHDNGKGFSPVHRPAKPGKSGFGLAGMAERAHLLGGSFRVRSASGQGTVMTVEFPLGGKNLE